MRIPLRAIAALLLIASLRVHAASSYDSCTGFIGSLPAVISQQGTWCLNKDLNTAMASGAAIVVANNNVTIDCNGFKLGGLGAGVGTQAVGVESTNRLNTTIRGCRIRGFLKGVVLAGSGGGHLLEDAVIEGSTFVGAIVYGAGSVIRRNRILDTGGSTFVVGQAVGIEVGGTVDVLDNDISGIVPSMDAEFSSANTYGLLVYGGSGVRIVGNRFRDIQAFGWSLPHAIVMSNTSRSEVADNFVASTYAGVFCGSATDTAHGNLLSGVGVPVWVCTSGGNTIVD